MRDAIVFASNNQLEFQDIRSNVIRIPEVAIRVREAQQIWDTLGMPALDLANFIGSDDAVFLGNIRMKSFATAVIQIGLLDRFLKTQTLPKIVLGTTTGEAPLKVVIGQMTFHELIRESAAQTVPRKLQAAASMSELPVLAGVPLPRYAAFEQTDEGTYRPLEADVSHIERLIETLVHDKGLQRLIVVGPGNTVLRASQSLRVCDSIEMDAQLSWFWQTPQVSLSAVN